MALPFPKSVRLLQRSQFQQVYGEGQRRQSSHFVFFTQPQAATAVASRVGITVSRKVGHATERNRIRRRTREAVRLHLRQLGVGWDVVINPRRSVLQAAFSALEREMAAEFRILADRRARAAGGDREG
ncbi:MAG: ribonuclease P protein component [Terriglobales bacterium]